MAILDFDDTMQLYIQQLQGRVMILETRCEDYLHTIQDKDIEIAKWKFKYELAYKASEWGRDED